MEKGDVMLTMTSKIFSTFVAYVTEVNNFMTTYKSCFLNANFVRHEKGKEV